jgi:protein-tyrosine phosphatase
MRHLLEQRGLSDQIEVDSAGTSGYHVGDPPDRRATRAAKTRGIRLSGQSRRFVFGDFERFDYVVAMDRSNFAELQALTRTPAEAANLSLLRDHEPTGAKGLNVPDPYYGGDDGFDEVLDICEAACAGLLRDMTQRLSG